MTKPLTELYNITEGDGAGVFKADKDTMRAFASLMLKVIGSGLVPPHMSAWCERVHDSVAAAAERGIGASIPRMGAVGFGDSQRIPQPAQPDDSGLSAVFNKPKAKKPAAPAKDDELGPAGAARGGTANRVLTKRRQKL